VARKETANSKFLQNYLRRWFPSLDDAIAQLGGFVDVEFLDVSTAHAFSAAFVQSFMAEQPNYKFNDGTYGASRSNWTYHIAGSISQVSKLMELTCKFETLGKRDAIIETKNDPTEVVLVAEWEWDGEDVFGKAKELEKLWTTCREHPEAGGFLLTYCTAANYVNYLKRITEYWLNAARRRSKTPVLYLHTIIYRDDGAIREFEILRTADIDADLVRLWPDKPF
jgi:hypothetical protein